MLVLVQVVVVVVVSFFMSLLVLVYTNSIVINHAPSSFPLPKPGLACFCEECIPNQTKTQYSTVLRFVPTDYGTVQYHSRRRRLRAAISTVSIIFEFSFCVSRFIDRFEFLESAILALQRLHTGEIVPFWRLRARFGIFPFSEIVHEEGAPYSIIRTEHSFYLCS